MQDFLERWLDALDAAGALIGDRAATKARLEGWVPWIDAAAGGDDAAQAELLRIVALDASNLAQEGRAASSAVTQPLLLDRAWPTPTEAQRRLAHLLVRVAADAHALGAAGVKDLARSRLLARHTPIVPIGRGCLGFIIGPIGPDVVDGVIGRLLQVAAGVGATEVALDLSGAEPPNALLSRTLAGFVTVDTGPVRRLTVTGVEAPDALAEVLHRKQVPDERVTVSELTAWIVGVNDH